MSYWNPTKTERLAKIARRVHKNKTPRVRRHLIGKLKAK